VPKSKLHIRMSTAKSVGLLVSVALLTLSLAAQAPQGPSVATAAKGSFDETVRPFVEKNCQSCHNAALVSGGLNFEQLRSADTLSLRRDVWDSVVYKMQMGQMPPQGSPRPPRDQIEKVLAFLNSELNNGKAGASFTPAQPATQDWLTWGYDPERTGWARAETTLRKDNASRLELLWRAQLDTAPNPSNVHSTLTDPLVVENVATREGAKTLVFVASADNTVYAIDAAAGKVFWRRAFPNTLTPVQPANGSCPNNLNATPVIDKQSGTIYVLTTDGKLRGLGLSDGDDRMPPTEFVTPYSRNWSLNLIDGIVYVPSARGCGLATSSFMAMDVRSPSRTVMRFYPSTGKASGAWGRGGLVRSQAGILGQTADGVYDPAGGRFGQSVLSLTKDLRLADSYTPSDWDYLNKKDFDLGSSSPVVFPFEKWTIVATAAKEGKIYLLDAMNLGGEDHHTPLYISPRYGNDAGTFGYTGVWGALSTWVDARGQRWLLVPMMGPPAKDTVSNFKISNGAVVNGSIMAFQVKLENNKPVAIPVWMSGDLDLPGIPVAANGVIFVLADGDRGATLVRPAGGRGGPAPPGGRGAPGQRVPGGAAGRGGPQNQVNPDQPGAYRDAAWLASQRGPDGQQGGRRFSGGRDVTHAVLYALDAATGKEIYSSKDLIDSWNHYGGLALANGRLYLSTYDARVFAFGLKK